MIESVLMLISTRYQSGDWEAVKRRRSLSFWAENLHKVSPHQSAREVG